ncbi:MAG TPA: FAD-binding oxidoreductase [Bryobacteraceae bacterium]|nr:FAD-binding oxidoreductase [Bryobacteraceae bacterium]
MTGNGARLARQWQGQFEGQLLTPVDDAYEASRRIWNGMIDNRPELIARCVSAADIRAAVKLASAELLPVSVRGGGHGVAGTAVCDGGLMIDLSRMKDIRVDPVSRQVTAAPGLLWGEFDRATQAHGLATTGGQVSHTGIAGLTLGGGIGYLMGKHGATCDNLLSVDLVTADGEMLTASVEQNPDLFWAVRGAGANFGIVTSFRYRLHPLGEVLAGLLLHPRELAGELIAFHREFLVGSPDELDTSIGFLNSPEGAPLVAVVAMYAGAPREGERVLEPLRKFGPPVADLIRAMPYTGVQSMLDDAAPVGDRYYWKSNFVSEIAPGLVSVLRDGAAAMPSPHSIILLFEIKGEIRRVPRAAMAFDHRDANFELSIIARWTDPGADAANIGWAREVWNAAQPFVSAGVYANHLTADETGSRVRAAYGAEKYDKLAMLKARYDPGNFFRLNHNIPPRGA